MTTCYSFNGMAARLTPPRRGDPELPNVVSVTEDTLHSIDTSSTPDYLGLSGDHGLWAKLRGPRASARRAAPEGGSSSASSTPGSPPRTGFTGRKIKHNSSGRSCTATSTWAAADPNMPAGSSGARASATTSSSARTTPPAGAGTLRSRRSALGVHLPRLQRARQRTVDRRRQLRRAGHRRRRRVRRDQRHRATRPRRGVQGALLAGGCLDCERLAERLHRRDRPGGGGRRRRDQLLRRRTQTNFLNIVHAAFLNAAAAGGCSLRPRPGTTGPPRHRRAPDPVGDDGRCR